MRNCIVPVFRRLALCAVFAASAFAMPGVVAPASAQNIFQLIFGGQQRRAEPQYRELRIPGPGYRKRDARRQRAKSGKRYSKRKQEKRDGRRVASSNGPMLEKSDFKIKPYVPPKVGRGPLGRFLYDRTLRRGDIVVTGKGLMVFAGRDRKEHRDKDFLSLARGGNLTGMKKSTLYNINKHSGDRSSDLVRVRLGKTYKAPLQEPEGLKTAAREQ
ncbi:MAG: hypothetical protein AB7F96_16975 [Beijerinckiaceae bacterium]